MLGILIKEGRFTDNIKTIHLIKLRLYRENLVPQQCQLQKTEHIFELMLVCVSHDGCVTEFSERSKPETARAFSLAQRAQVSLWLPKAEVRLQQCLCPLFAPSVEFTEQLTLHGSPFLQAEIYFCIPELQNSYEPSATKPVSWGRAISTIEISSFKPWLSSLPWLCRFSPLSWKDGAQGTILSFLKNVSITDNQIQNKHFPK